MPDFLFRWQDVYTPARYSDAKPSKQYFAPSEPQETSIPNSGSRLNHSPGMFDMSFNEIITISSDSESEIDADAVENGEGSLQCNEVWPLIDNASLYTAATQTDKNNESQKHDSASHGANEANGLYQLDLSTIGQSSEASTINTEFSASCPDSSIQTPELSFTSPAFTLPQTDETGEGSQNPVNSVQGCVDHTPASSTSTPPDIVPYTPETCSLTQLCPDIINIFDAEANSNEISFMEPKWPTFRRTRRAEVLHAASTLEQDGLDGNYSSASNKTGRYYDYSNKSENSDSDDEDGDDDEAVSEYCPSEINSGRQGKHHLDNNTDDENKQPRRKRCKHEQSLAKSGPSRYMHDGRSHSPASTRPSTPRRKITPKRNQPSPAMGAVYEERTFSDGTTVKRAIIDGKEILQIDQPGAKDGLRLERPYTIHTQRNITACDKRGTTVAEIAGNRAKRTPRLTFTPKEDRLLKRLRVKEQLPWDAVYREFNNEFPDRRSCASLKHFVTRFKACFPLIKKAWGGYVMSTPSIDNS